MKGSRRKSKKVNKAWLHDHVNDPYVKLAQQEGYRARAAYKLKEIDETLGLIKPGQLVVDLGSTPGRLEPVRAAQVRRGAGAAAAAGELNGTIIALDMLPMEPIEGVDFIQGDFREADGAGAARGGAGRPARSTWWCPTWRPTCRASQSADAARIAAPGRAGDRFRAAPPEAGGRAGRQGVSRQRLQPAGRAVQGDASGPSSRSSRRPRGTSRPKPSWSASA